MALSLETHKKLTKFMSSDWWNQEKDSIWGTWLKAPCTKSWCSIFVGSNPAEGMTKNTASRFDVFLNVADTACVTFEPYPYKRTYHYWYPVAEWEDWTYGLFYKVFKTLDHHTDQGHVIYHHCHAGYHRSALTMLYYLMYKGESKESAWEMLGKEARPDLMTLEKNDYLAKSLPDNLEQFIELMRKMPDMSLGDILWELKNTSK
jgi:hypothetical protein